MALFGTVPALVWALFLHRPCPSLVYPHPPYMHSFSPGQCASLVDTGTTGHPGYTPWHMTLPSAYTTSVQPRPRVWSCRGAHSCLHPWTHALSLSPARLNQA